MKLQGSPHALARGFIGNDRDALHKYIDPQGKRKQCLACKKLSGGV
jgi:hypothetical protein